MKNKKKWSYGTWFVLLLLTALAVALVGVSRRLGSQAAQLSDALLRQRVHSSKLVALRSDSRQTFIGILERWLKPPAERPQLRKALEAMVEHVRQEGADFAGLEALSAVEAEKRAQLVNDLAAWASSMAVSIDTDEGPEGASEIHRYFDTVAEDMGEVAKSIDAETISSEAGLARLDQNRSGVQLGFGLLILSFLVVLFWLRERVRTDARIQTAEQAGVEREQTIKRQSQYFASMSHELRSPLVAIRALVTEIQDDEAASAPTRATSQRIHREAGDLLALINNILDAAKLEAGHVTLLLEPVQLRDVLERCLVRGRALVGNKPVKLELEMPACQPIVQGDFIKLQQIFTNLLTNAIKFTQDGKVVIRVRASDRDATAPIVVEVEDTGIGMSEEQMKSIWEPYRQGDDQVARAYGGTGLGLSIVKRLVELHDATVAVQSTPGVGSTFRVVLPVTHGVAKGEPAARSVA